MTTRYCCGYLSAETRNAIPADLSKQLEDLLTGGNFSTTCVTCDVVEKTTMSYPSAGQFLFSIALNVPNGTTVFEIQTRVANAVNALVIPTSPRVECTSVKVF